MKRELALALSACTPTREALQPLRGSFIVDAEICLFDIPPRITRGYPLILNEAAPVSGIRQTEATSIWSLQLATTEARHPRLDSGDDGPTG